MSWFEIGPWNHGLLPVLEEKCTNHAENSEVKKALVWFDLTLKQRKIPQGRVRYYVCGQDRWEEVKTWGNSLREEKFFYLDDGHMLTDTVPECGGAKQYLYDPSQPKRTYGGDCLLQNFSRVGSLRQPEDGLREDTLFFVSEPFKQDIVINGKIEAELWVKTDCSNTAFIVHFSEVSSEGKVYHIRTGATTIRHELPRGQAYIPNTPIKVVADASDICYALNKGCRLRVDITSSDFPQYHIHSNQEGNWAEAAENKIARQTILYGKEHPSRVRMLYEPER